MAESNEDKLSRVEQMSLDDGSTWDLSPNDQTALAYVIERITTLEAALRPLLVEDEVLDGVEDAWEVPMTYPGGVLRAAAKAMEGR